MVAIESSTERHDGVTLVTATVEGADVPTRIRVESRLDGPVWPPRRQGTPTAGWQEDGFEGVVPADGHLALGFATPATPVDPPLEITDVEPVMNSNGAIDSDGATAQDDVLTRDDAMTSPEAIVRGLGDPTPPSLIDPDESGRNECDEPGGASDTGDSPSGSSDVDPAAFGGASSTEVDQHIEQAQATDHEQDVACEQDEAALPPEIEEWLSSMAARIDRAAGLQTQSSVARATESLRASGGVEGARALDAEIAADVGRLRALEQRAARLAERAESTHVATDALDRLA